MSCDIFEPNKTIEHDQFDVVVTLLHDQFDVTRRRRLEKQHRYIMKVVTKHVLKITESLPLRLHYCLQTSFVNTALDQVWEKTRVLVYER